MSPGRGSRRIAGGDEPRDAPSSRSITAIAPIIRSASPRDSVASMPAMSSCDLRSSFAKACRPFAVRPSRYCRRSEGSGLRVTSPLSSKFWMIRLR
jgi:hypothetical protein